MQDGSTLVFVEVRLRSRSDFGGAAASVTQAKQKKLLAAARQYLASLKTLPPCRFDVVALTGSAAPEWIRNAFEDMG
jgi:putative endonuclease